MIWNWKNTVTSENQDAAALQETLRRPRSRTYTEDEVAAREAAAAEAMREACAERAGQQRWCGGGAVTCAQVLEVAIRALPLPAADALARALERARAEEREICAEIARAAGAPAVVALIRRNTPAAIRARGKEPQHDR